MSYLEYSNELYKAIDKVRDAVWYDDVVDDIENKKNELNNQINGRSVLVIGGAGSIGSSFIKAILVCCPPENSHIFLFSSLVVKSNAFKAELYSFL